MALKILVHGAPKGSKDFLFIGLHRALKILLIGLHRVLKFVDHFVHRAPLSLIFFGP